MSDAPRWTDADIALLGSIYEMMCTAIMNAYYYEQRLTKVQAISFWMEIALAATASGSGLASLTLFQEGFGHSAWQVLAVSAAAVSIIRPIYAPGKKIETFTRQQQGYHTNFFNLKKLAFSIRQEGGVSPEHKRRYDTFFDRHVQLSTEDEAAPIRWMVKEAQRRTEEALPPGSFWYPKAALDAPEVATPRPAEPEAAPAPKVEVAGHAEEITPPPRAEALPPARGEAAVAPMPVAVPMPQAEPIRLRSVGETRE